MRPTALAAALAVASWLPAGTAHADTYVTPTLAVPDDEAPAVAAFLADYAVVHGQAVRIAGELVPVTLDLPAWLSLAACESGGRWHLTGGKYRGGLQFLPSTWRHVGGQGDPAEASIDEQIARGRKLLDLEGPAQWPHCSTAIGWS